MDKLSGDRRCFRKIGGVLVEKDLQSIKKDLGVELSNLKQTLDVVNQTMKQQEDILNQFEKQYADVIKPQIKKMDTKTDANAEQKAKSLLT